MTKTKIFMSTLGVLAAAGAVLAGVLVKKRGKIKVEGELETRRSNGGGIRPANRSVRGQASVGATGNRQS